MVQVTPAVPEPVTDDGEAVQLELLVVSDTVPLNPLRPATVTVLDAVPTFAVTVVGLTVTVKSCMTKATVTE